MGRIRSKSNEEEKRLLPSVHSSAEERERICWNEKKVLVLVIVMMAITSAVTLATMQERRSVVEMLGGLCKTYGNSSGGIEKIISSQGGFYVSCEKEMEGLLYGNEGIAGEQDTLGEGIAGFVGAEGVAKGEAT